MHETDPTPPDALQLDPDFDDRLTALELRIAGHDRALHQAVGHRRVALLLMGMGIALAIATAFQGSPLFALFSLAAALVVFGLDSRGLATATAVAAVAGLLIAVVFLPALHEIDHRTQQAVDNLVLTATASQPMMGAGPALGGFDEPLAFPTFGPIDVGIDGDGAVLPEP